MRFLVTGAKGQLGYDVLKELSERNFTDVIGIGIDDLDLTKEIDVHLFVEKVKPDIIIHCAAFTAVDKAEDLRDKCMDINVNGTKHLTNASISIDAKMLYISTDYVFDGNKEGFYDVDDKTTPLSTYGLSKYLGEVEVVKNIKHFIVRTSWVFGKNGYNFVKTMLKLGKEGVGLKVINDQFGSPTYTKDLSSLLIDMVLTERYGVYHATNEGICSWYEFTKEIFRLVGYKTQIYPIKTSDYPTKAKRPMNSKMSKVKLEQNGFNCLADWKDALKRYMKEIEVL
jgi:dTDP-4-dehydrorhamnose reductase